MNRYLSVQVPVDQLALMYLEPGGLVWSIPVEIEAASCGARWSSASCGAGPISAKTWASKLPLHWKNPVPKFLFLSTLSVGIPLPPRSAPQCCISDTRLSWMCTEDALAELARLTDAASSFVLLSFIPMSKFPQLTCIPPYMMNMLSPQSYLPPTRAEWWSTRLSQWHDLIQHRTLISSLQS